MDVAVSDLRAHLSEWLDRARAGEEVVVTERGVPVVRLLGIGATETLERLTAEGVIARPAARPATNCVRADLGPVLADPYPQRVSDDRR